MINGKSMLDLTGGFGVDSYFFSRKTERLVYCEIDQELSEIAAHNFRVLGAQNVDIINIDGIIFLERSTEKFDWIYADPSRRNNGRGKVFQLADCIPNVPKYLTLLLAKSDNILIKTSPLLDISLGLKEFRCVREIHVVAVNNEVKELLWVLQKGQMQEAVVKTINLNKTASETFDFYITDEKNAVSSYGEASPYLFEPNAAIMKSGAFKSIGNRYSLRKLHEHTHLYTADQRVRFPGRQFKLIQNLAYSRKALKASGIGKANITTRNFPENVATIRKKFKIREGGDEYLFFVTDHKHAFRVLRCAKV
jgi:hypothetical protein